MKPKRPELSRMTRLSFRLFVASAVAVPLTIGLLVLGMLATGGGHGSTGPMYFAVGVSWLTWLLLGASSVAAYRVWRQEERIVWWGPLLGCFFLAWSGVGLWGLSG